jgi:predicted dehydrogenase
LVVNLGIIGLGTIGKFVLNGAILHPGYRVVAVFDINKPELEDDSSIAIVDSVHDMLSRDDIDLIYIGTPPNSHIDYCYQVLESGKALWCEKPLATDIKESEALINFINKNNSVGAVNLSLATNPILIKLSALIKSIPTNEHCSIEMQFHFSSWPRVWQKDANKWLSSKTEGGFLREVFSHFVFLQHRIYGQLELISSDIEYDSTTKAESYVRADYISNGIPVRLTCTIGGSAPEKNEWTLFTKTKAVRYSKWNTIEIGDDNGWLTIEIVNTSSVTSQLDELLKLMDEQPNKLATFKEGFEVQKVIENTILQAKK